MTMLAAGLLVSGLAAGCMAREPESETTGGMASESSEAGAAGGDSANEALEPFLPATASYTGPEDFVSTWTVTKNDDGTFQVKDTVGDFDTIYTVTVDGGCVRQTSQMGMSGEPEDAEAIWFCVPPKSFTNDYTLNGKEIHESAVEKWVTDENLGQVLEVTKKRTIDGVESMVVERWAAGLGLVSRVATDASGKVTERREIIFAGS